MKCSFSKVSFFIFILFALGDSVLFAEKTHIVEKGDTLYSISRKYNVKVDEIKSLNGFSDNNISVGQKLRIPGNDSSQSKSAQKTVAETHTVQKGETLYSISRKYGLSVEQVKAFNGLSGNELKVGQVLKLNADAVASSKTEKTDSKKTESSQKSEPNKKENENPSPSPVANEKPAPSKSVDGIYVVQKGDTWSGIAHDFGLSIAELQNINKVDSDAVLKIGQKLKISNVPDLKENDPHKYLTKKGDASLVWPVKTSDVTYVKGKVSGVNLSARKDENVTSIMAGTVMFCGAYRGFGNVIFIQSKTGHIYAYSGLGNITVSKGQYVDTGAKIGTAGVDTYSQRSQISLMVFQNGQPIDPAKAPRG